MLQDGSSFAIKDSLRSVFPGRFNKIKPAAVEIHATYSGLSDQVIRATVTPDTFSERAELPSLDWLRGKLLMADRGIPENNTSPVNRGTRQEKAGRHGDQLVSKSLCARLR